MARMARIAGASFDLDVTQVSASMYARCVAAGRCTEVGTGVSLLQAKAYCAWVGKRLPTDAEWTMAATGVDGDRHLAPGEATPDGVMDMGSNVVEWMEGRVRADRVTGFRCARDSQAW